MYSLIKYLTGSKSKRSEQQLDITVPEIPKLTKRERVKKYVDNQTVYLVIEKNTQNPLGIFDTLELAKQNGQKTTHYNCIVIPFKINDPCKYLFNTAFEDR